MTSIRPSQRADRYFHTTPELRAQRQRQVRAFVEKVEKEDRATQQTLQVIGVTSAATLAAGVIAATQFRGEAVRASAPSGSTQPMPASAQAVLVAPDALNDPIAAAANEGIRTGYQRQDGKKLDYHSEATDAYRFQGDLGRSVSDQLRQGERIDNAARVDQHIEGRPIDGRGSNSEIFGQSFRAPPIPSLKNFQPVRAP